jgi:hypothetical protein
MKKTSPIENAVVKQETFYASSAASEQMNTYNDAAAEFGMVACGSSYFNKDYSNLTPNLSGRPGLTRNDYDQFRPTERIPTKHKDIVKFAERVYKKNGLVHNIIDLMGDFACQGIRISCANKRDERFYKNWFNRVGGVDRSERFANNLYRTGNIIIRRQTAVIDLKTRSKLFKASAKSDLKVEKEVVKKGEIPWRYIYLCPTTVDVIGGSVACFANNTKYCLTIPQGFKTKLVNSTSKEEKELLNSLPTEIKKAIETGKPIPLPEDKTLVFHYKKDDWDEWAHPMTYAIFDDIILLEKYKLADSAALDGVISSVRVWKLGHIGTGKDDRILPGPAAANKLKEILGSHVMGGTIDIVWGPDIELVESKSESYKFLGEDKYKPALDAIYGGLGIPATLTGSGEKGGATNNFISLQTLIQRLEYGRQVLLEFWNKELALLAEAVGLEPAVVEFDYMDLGDPAAKLALLVQLSDRSLISDETVQHEFKKNPELEQARIMRENEEREKDERPDKAGPFYEGEPDAELEKAAVQKGYLTPGQVGLKPKQLGQRVKNLDKTKPKPTTAPKGVSGQGRPKNSKDSVKRKPKTFSPRSKASVELWAASAQEKIAEYINPAILHSFEKKNMRSLTATEAKQAEKIRFGVLFSIQPFTEITKEKVAAAFALSDELPKEVYQAYSSMANDVLQDLGRELTFEETRQIQVRLYGEVYNEDSD